MTTPVDINGFTCEKVSEACPEAYDVFRDGEYVGRLRLRYGIFVARNAQDAVVYRADTPSDGIFSSNTERLACLREGIMALARDCLTR